MSVENQTQAVGSVTRLVGPFLAAKVTFGVAPVGLFDFEGTLCVKTEYSHQGRPEAYIVDSGEYFWGGAKTAAEANALLVTPLHALPAQIQPQMDARKEALLRDPLVQEAMAIFRSNTEHPGPVQG